MAVLLRLHLLLLVLLGLWRSVTCFLTPQRRWVARTGLGQLRMTAGQQSAEELVSDLRKMRAKELKLELTGRGVSSAGIVDKEDLVQLLLKARLNEPKPEDAVHMPRQHGARDYAVARTTFRRKTPPAHPQQSGSSAAAPGPKCYVAVDLVVQGRSFEFLIDSGATPTIVTESMRQSLRLETLAGGQQLHGVSAGGAASAPRVMLMGAVLGGPGGYMVNMDALVTPDVGTLPQGVSGLLGIKYLQYFGIVDFDFRSSTLSLYAYDSQTETGSRRLEDLLNPPISPALLASRGAPIKQDPFSQLFFVDLSLGGPSAPPVPVIVDLGAGLSMVNWLAAKQVGVSPSSPGLIRDAMKVWGIDGRPLPVDLMDFGQVLAGKTVPMPARRIGIADLPAFQLIGFGSKPVGVLGMDFLGAERLIFDFRNNMLYTL